MRAPVERESDDAGQVGEVARLPLKLVIVDGKTGIGLGEHGVEGGDELRPGDARSEAPVSAGCEAEM